MSESPIYLDGSIDALSTVFAGLQLSAEVYVSGDFCGNWAVDTSGSRRVPFHLIGQGCAWLHLNESEPRRLGAGDLVIFPGDRSHVIANSEEMPKEELINADFSANQGPMTNMVCGFFEFQNKAAWPLLESLDSAIVLELSDMGKMPAVRSLIELMLGELERREPGYYANINQLAYLIFVHAIRAQIDSGKVRTGLLTAMFDSKISRALAAIHNRPAESWNLAALAAEALMGRSSFAQRFNELIGMPAMQYLTYWRMQNATALLTQSELSVWQIAEQSGYESEPAFRKAYKKVTGTAPGRVRRLARQEV